MHDPAGESDGIGLCMIQANPEDQLKCISGMAVVTNKMVLETGSIGVKRFSAEMAGEQTFRISVLNVIAANQAAGGVTHGAFFCKDRKYREYREYREYRGSRST